MTRDLTDAPASTPENTGLRGRKKARRRQEILQSAARLFAENGVDATTLAEIAQATDVSPPTIANYFGSKENILSALIFEGTERERTAHLSMPRRTGCAFSDILGQLLCEFTENTLRIAGKRVWRYAEASNIRHPGSEFEVRFAHSDAELLKLIAAFIADYDVVLRSGETVEPRFMAQIFYDRWTMLYLAYIKDDAMALETHKDRIREDVRALVQLLFDDAFAARAPLKAGKAAG